MKKRFIALFVAMLMVVTLFTACGSSEAETAETEIIRNETTQVVVSESVGSYCLFRTKDVQEYLNFLENFDETKYEIVDISTSMWTGMNGSGEFYMVTYKVIAEE